MAERLTSRRAASAGAAAKPPQSRGTSPRSGEGPPRAGIHRRGAGSGAATKACCPPQLVARCISLPSCPSSGATILTGIATAVLAVGAIVTAVLSYLAFRKQSREVGRPGEMLELQRRQLAEQEKTSAEQAEVLGLQARELQGSLEEREREAEERRRGQASMVAVWFAWAPVTSAINPDNDWGATVRNASDLPVLDVRAAFHRVTEPVRGLDWNPVSAGMPEVDPGPAASHRAAPPDRPRPRRAGPKVRRRRVPRQHHLHRRRRDPVGARPARSAETDLVGAGQPTALQSFPQRAGHFLR